MKKHHLCSRLKLSPLALVGAALLWVMTTISAAAQAPAWNRSISFGGAAATSVGGITAGFATVVDAQGNQYVTGSFLDRTLTLGSVVLTNSNPSTSAATTDLFVAKYSPTGTVLWAARIGGQANDAGTDLAVDAAGNVFVAGAARLGGAGDDVLCRIATDAAGNVYVGGIFKSPIVVAGSTTLAARCDEYTGYVVKYDPQLAVQWARAEGAPAGGGSSFLLYGLTVSPDGDVTIAGASIGTTVVGTAGTIPDASGSYAPFVVRYSTQGQPTAVVSGRAAGGGGIMNGLARDAAGNAYAIGFFAGNLTWGGVSLPVGPDPSLFLIKLDAATLAPQWGVRPTPGGGGAGFAIGVAADVAGNCYLTGQYAGTLQFAGLPTLPDPVGPSAGFVAKLGNTPLAVRSALTLPTAPLGACR